MTRVKLAWLHMQRSSMSSGMISDPNYRKILRSAKMHNIFLRENLLSNSPVYQAFWDLHSKVFQVPVHWLLVHPYHGEMFTKHEVETDGCSCGYRNKVWSLAVGGMPVTWLYHPALVWLVLHSFHNEWNKRQRNNKSVNRRMCNHIAMWPLTERQ